MRHVVRARQDRQINPAPIQNNEDNQTNLLVKNISSLPLVFTA